MLKRILIVLILILVVMVVGFWGLSKYKNRRLMPDYFATYYKTQDTVPVGKVGIFVPGLVVPENYEGKGREFFYNITFKIFNTDHLSITGFANIRNNRIKI